VLCWRANLLSSSKELESAAGKEAIGAGQRDSFIPAAVGLAIADIVNVRVVVSRGFGRRSSELCIANIVIGHPKKTRTGKTGRIETTRGLPVRHKFAKSVSAKVWVWQIRAGYARKKSQVHGRRRLLGD
jgi:hypothetical protein